MSDRLSIPMLPHVLPADAAWIVIVDRHDPYEAPSISYFARRVDAEEEYVSARKLNTYEGSTAAVLLAEVSR